MLPRIKARINFGHAVNDQSMPAEAIEKLGRALASWGDEYDCETYEAPITDGRPGRALLQREARRPRFDQLTEPFTQTLK